MDSRTGWVSEGHLAAERTGGLARDELSDACLADRVSAGEESGYPFLQVEFEEAGGAIDHGLQ